MLFCYLRGFPLKSDEGANRFIEVDPFRTSIRHIHMYMARDTKLNESDTTFFANHLKCLRLNEPIKMRS